MEEHQTGSAQNACLRRSNKIAIHVLRPGGKRDQRMLHLHRWPKGEGLSME